MTNRASSRCCPNARPQGRLSRVRRQVANLALGLLGAACVVPVAAPVRAAERVTLNYGPLEFPISVQSLEAFAKDGTVHTDLAFLVNRLKPEQREQFRHFLNSRYQFSPVLMARFFYSSMGERLLTYTGELIQLSTRQNGFSGIRAGLIQAAADPNGLSPISFIQKFPTDIQLNTQRILQQWEQISTVMQETNTYISTLKQDSDAVKATEPSIDFGKLPNLQNPGPYRYVKQTKTLQDRRRNRQFIVNLYLPTVPEGKSSPLIVITNGLGTRLDLYDYLAEHLASYGFAIAIPQHPDSDDQQQQAFLKGMSREMFKTSAYIDRPLDITYLLNELERLNPSEFKNQLNLQQVGVFGNSFGGITALAVAGARMDFDQLEADCNPQKNLVNLSLLVQCQALQLPRQDYNFRDPRIKAAAVLFPGSSSLYGKHGMSQVNIPVLWGAASKDVFSSLVLEQLPSFKQLGSQNKYLVVADGIDHLNLNFYALKTLKNMDKADADALTVKPPELAKDYLKALNLAFFQVYLADRPEYRPYLSASYAQTMNRDDYRFILLKSLTDIYAAK